MKRIFLHIYTGSFISQHSVPLLTFFSATCDVHTTHVAQSHGFSRSWIASRDDDDVFFWVITTMKILLPPTTSSRHILSYSLFNNLSSCDVENYFYTRDDEFVLIFRQKETRWKFLWSNYNFKAEDVCSFVHCSTFTLIYKFRVHFSFTFLSLAPSTVAICLTILSHN